MLFSRRRAGRRLWNACLTLLVLFLLLFTIRNNLRPSSSSSRPSPAQAVAQDGGQELQDVGLADGVAPRPANVPASPNTAEQEPSVADGEVEIEDTSGVEGALDALLKDSVAQPLSPVFAGDADALLDLRPNPPPPQVEKEIWLPPGFRNTQREPGKTRSEINAAKNEGISRTVVMGQLSSEDTRWVEEQLPEWERAIYVVDIDDDSNGPTTIPSDVRTSSGAKRTPFNKAREATPYLTYIVSTYPNFTDVVAFIHSHRKQLPVAWHTDARNNDAKYMLQDLQLRTVQRKGYVNLRCVTDPPGCPAEVQPYRNPPDPGRHAEHAFPLFYAEFFQIPLAEVKERIDVVATPCCAQFAVSRQQILKRPRQDYERMLEFLQTTSFDDATSGRVMEYMWHIMFGRDAVYCPDIFECYCEVYGRCNLKPSFLKGGAVAPERAGPGGRPPAGRG